MNGLDGVSVVVEMVIRSVSGNATAMVAYVVLVTQLRKSPASRKVVKVCCDCE